MQYGTPLTLYNSLGRKLQEFVSLEPGVARFYSCGPTVYNYPHIGNLRAKIFEDTLQRILQWKGYEVVHVINITDVGHLTSDADEGEDKMEKAAQKEHRSVWEIAAYYTAEFQKDIAALNILPPAVLCKATDHIQEMINFALVCEQHKCTYELEDGLYLDTSKVKDYGRLALLDLAGMEDGARVAPRAGKKNISDFVLWRRSPKDKQRLMEWHSPWGVGAPGWHLECSAMSIKYLGRKFDIHTGGVDLRQVHHCNEIAQNQAFSEDETLGANFWIHNEFVNTGSQKMAKSAGSFTRLKDLVDAGMHPFVYRYFCLMATYRTPLDFSMEALSAARSGLYRLLKRIDTLKREAPAPTFEWLPIVSEMKFSCGASTIHFREYLEQGIPAQFKDYVKKLDAALSDDLNTPQALALVSMIAADSDLAPDTTLRLLAICDLALGLKLLELQPDDLNIRPVQAAIDEGEIQKLIERREHARASRDFKTADEIRKQLHEQGVALMDSDQGTTWEWATPS
jgi:cysteinyl-tRNA synthetase